MTMGMCPRMTNSSRQAPCPLHCLFSSLYFPQEFTQTLAEKDEEISALTREVADLKKKTKKSGSAGGDSTYYEQQNRELRQEKEEITAELAKLRGDLGAASVKVDGLMKEKAELDNRIRTQSKRIDELQRDNDNLTRKSQAVEEKNKEVTKQKSENNKAAQSWAQDNSRLSDEVGSISFS